MFNIGRLILIFFSQSGITTGSYLKDGFFKFVVGKTEQSEVICPEGVTVSAGICYDPLEKMCCRNESVVSDSPLPLDQSLQNLYHRISHDVPFLCLFFPNILLYMLI